ncbi:MAG: TolC family protein, partial [Phenylobacterium sp.]|nr:TolC family protein [Phenylobacterium sp.]
MKVAFSLAASALIAVFSLGSAPAFGETLEEAIALAYETNPTLLAQRSQVRVLDESYVQARAGLRPQLSASSTASYSNTSVNAGRGGLVDTNGDGIPDTNLTGSGVTERNFGNASVSVTQPVYTGGRTIASMSAAAADILSARET